MRRDTNFPIDSELCSYLKKAWDKGLFDEYSDEHFLIKAIENRLNHFVAIDQLINNNFNITGIIDENGNIDFDIFNLNFCINFSNKLNYLCETFGESSIERFITNQLSAGKKNYSEDTFFQALSEVSILSFFAAQRRWDNVSYEPRLLNTSSKKNPEASFCGLFTCDNNMNPDPKQEKKVKINVEVKSARFMHDSHQKERIAIPTVLLTPEGQNLVKKYCNTNDIKYLDPRILTLRDFINSAASKFNLPGENEYNLLYINWSFRDFSSNSFLEPWSLLTNEINGVLTHSEAAKSIDIDSDALEKISAIIVYTESLEGLMFGDFRYVWQNNGAGNRFRMWIIDNELRQLEEKGLSNILFYITGMRPCKCLNQHVMIDYKSKNYTEAAEGAYHSLQLSNLIKTHIKKSF